MKKILRIIFFLLLILFLSFAVALGVGIYQPKVFEGLLNKVVYSKTGYQFSTKNLEVQFFPTKIIVQNFILENPNWKPDPKLLSVQDAEFSIDVQRFFKSKFPYWYATLSNAEIKWHEDEMNLNWNTPFLVDRKKSEDQQPLDLNNLFSFSEINLTQSKLQQQRKDIVETIDITSLKLQRADESALTLQGVGIYQEQPVAIEGSLEIIGDEPIEQMLTFILQAKGLGIDLRTDGSLNPSNLDGAKVSLKANSEDLSEIEQFLETTFPAITPVEVSLDFEASRGRYEFSKIDLKLGDNQLMGDLVFDQKDSFVRVNLISDRVDLSPFIDVENTQKIQEQHEENAINSVNEEEEIDWSWVNSLNSEINLNIDEVVLNQHRLRELHSQLELVDGMMDIHSIQARFEFANEENPARSIATELIQINGSLQPLAEKTQGKDLQIDLEIKDSAARVELIGEANVNGSSGNNLTVKADVKKLDALAKYLQVDFFSYLPANVSANVATTDHGLLLDQFVARFNESDLSADINVDWSHDIVKIAGVVDSKFIDLSPLMSESDNNANTKDEDVTKKIFSDEAIDWSWLDSFDINADLSIKKLVADKNVFNDFSTKIDLGEGELSIAPIQTYFAGGSVNSVLKLKKIGPKAALDIQLDALNLSLAELGATGESVLEGGTTDVVLILNGTGQSLHQIMATLNGEVVAEVQKGVIKNDSFEMIGTDVLFELLSTLNPFMKEDETTILECAAVKFLAKDGILTSNNQIAVETSKIKIVGGGVINLNTEELEIGFSPSAKKGLGVNVSSLVKFVRLGGTLSNPHPEADPVGLLKSGAAIGAAVSTGGLSLLVEGLFKRAANSGSACNQVLKDEQPANENGKEESQDVREIN